jgi:NADH-quinone oxidoreductase subunit L
LPARLPLLTRVVRERFYLDEIYAALIVGTQDALARLADWLDRHVVAGFLVRGSHGSTEFAGRALRLLQTGNLQTYAFLLAAGVVLLLYFVLGG